MKKILTAGVVLFFILGAFPIYSQATTTGTEQGTKFGNVIKAIITTALPSVKDLLDAIWPKKANNAKVERTDIKTLEAKLISYQETTKQKIAKDKSINDALAELSAINSFLIPTNKIQDFLRDLSPSIGGEQISANEWKKAKEYWDKANVQINKIQNIATNDASPFLKDTLKRIAQTDRNDIDNISIEYFNRDLNYINERNSGRLPELRRKISALLSIYQQVPSLLVTYFDCLKIDIINSQAAIKGPEDNKNATAKSIEDSNQKIVLMMMGVSTEVKSINDKIKESQGKLK